MTEHPDKLDTGFIEYILSAYRASTKEHSGSGAQREEKKSENAQWHEPGLNHFISFIDEMPGGFFLEFPQFCPQNRRLAMRIIHNFQKTPKI